MKIIPKGLTCNSPFVYIIRHKISDRLYVGYKYCRRGKSGCDSTTFMTKTGYQTSSKVIKKMIKEFGLDSFETLFICHFETGKQAHDFEIEYQIAFKADVNPRFLNQHIDGEDFNTIGKYPSLEVRRKMSDSQKRRGPMPEHTRMKISESNKGKIKYMPTKEQTDNFVKQMSGRKWWNDGVVNKFVRDCPNIDWKLGRLTNLSAKTRTLISTANKGRSYWNNGIIQKASFTCPGIDWTRGRLKHKIKLQCASKTPMKNTSC